MPPDSDPQSLSLLWSELNWLGGSILGILGFIVIIYTIRPNLTIERVIDKHNRLAFESRLLIKNLGKLPAYNIWPNVYHCHFRVGGLKEDNLTLFYNGQPTEKLSGGETMEIATLPQVIIPPGIPIDECIYQLVLEYEARLPFYRKYHKKLKKKYRVELRPLGEEFAWQFSMC